jgi:putative ABC transport system permease protein
MSLLYLAWKNLVHKPWAMFLSLVLFALGTGLITLLLLMQRQLQENFENNLAGVDLVIGAKGSPLQLILSSMYHIDAPTGNISLKEAKPFLNPNHPLIGMAVPLSLGDSYRGYRIVGTTHDFLDLYGAQPSEGRIWTANMEATIGAAVARESFWLVHGEAEHDHTGDSTDTEAPSNGVMNADHEHEDHEHADHEHADHEHSVEGHEHTQDEKDMPTGLLEEDETLDITSLLIKFKARNYQALNMQRNINENTDMQAATPAIEINRLFSLMSTGERVLTILAWVITIVSGLSVFISLFSSLRDRRYELALMRVMGGSRTTQFVLIILEGLLLSGIGCLIGILLSHGAMQVLGGAMEASYRYHFTGLRFLHEEVYIIGGALVVGFIAAIIPAIQAARTDIAKTLTEG